MATVAVVTVLAGAGDVLLKAKLPATRLGFAITNDSPPPLFTLVAMLDRLVRPTEMALVLESPFAPTWNDSDVWSPLSRLMPLNEVELAIRASSVWSWSVS